MGKPDQGSAAAAGARRATGDATDRAGRFSAGRKRAVVLRLLRGEDLESVSRELGITAARASQWREQFLAAGPPRRPGPVGAASDDVLVGHIRRVLAVSWRRVSESLGEAAGGGDPHRKGPGTPVNARARPAGAAPHGPRAWPGGARWDDHHRGPRRDVGTDMTTTVTVGEGTACVFVTVDHCTTECIGLHAAKSGNRFEALEPIRQGVRARFGGIGDDVACGLRLRHDHGSQYLADDFQQEIAFFGIESSPSFVREPEGNGVAERFIRTLKENVLWVQSFETIEQLRLALLAFKRTYNEQWMLAKYDYRSPAHVRRDLAGLDTAA